MQKKKKIWVVIYCSEWIFGLHFGYYKLEYVWRELKKKKKFDNSLEGF